VKDQILNRRARELNSAQAPELTLQQLRANFGGAKISDDELLLRYFAGKDDVERMKSAAPVRAYLSGQLPLVRLIEELSKQKNFRQVVVQRGNLAIRLERPGRAGQPWIG
jgi:oxaloacetate decarboxylase alpha subunit